jgi:Protein of unknown function (DUF3102)
MNAIEAAEVDFALKIESAEQANEAHRRILNSLQVAIAVGEFLSQKKSELGHGNWIPWVQENLDFSDRTASNYIRTFKNADFLNQKGISDSTEAYRLLINRAKSENNRESKRKEHEEKVIQFQAGKAKSEQDMAQHQPAEPKDQLERIVPPASEPDYPEVLREVERSIFEVVGTYTVEGSHSTEQCYKLGGLVADQLADLSERFRRGSKAELINTTASQPDILYNPDDDLQTITDARADEILDQVKKEFDKFVAQLKKTLRPCEYWFAINVLIREPYILDPSILDELRAFEAAQAKAKKEATGREVHP